jgi:hypothetical protein
MLEHLQDHGFNATGGVRADEQGWITAEIEYTPGRPPLRIERYLATETGVRNELNAWAAWLETREAYPEAAGLMEQIVSSSQVFTMEQRDAPTEICRNLCQWLACQTEGVYEIDGLGMFAADGGLLVPAEECG